MVTGRRRARVGQPRRPQADRRAGRLRDRPCGPRRLDVGASTGGFTDVLLASAARPASTPWTWATASWPRSCAGTSGSSRWSGSTPARSRPRRCRSRSDLAVIDVSFISLALVLGPVRSVLRDGRGPIVALVKPQFEAGRADAKGGVVRDRDGPPAGPARDGRRGGRAWASGRGTSSPRRSWARRATASSSPGSGPGRRARSWTSGSRPPWRPPGRTPRDAQRGSGSPTTPPSRPRSSCASAPPAGAGCARSTTGRHRPARPRTLVEQLPDDGRPRRPRRRRDVPAGGPGGGRGGRAAPRHQPRQGRLPVQGGGARAGGGPRAARRRRLLGRGSGWASPARSCAAGPTRASCTSRRSTTSSSPAARWPGSSGWTSRSTSRTSPRSSPTASSCRARPARPATRSRPAARSWTRRAATSS